MIHLLPRLCIESIRILTGERQRFERELEEVAEQRVALEEELARSQAQLRVLQADAEDVEAREQELQHQRDILGLNASDAERGICFPPIKIISCWNFCFCYRFPFLLIVKHTFVCTYALSVCKNDFFSKFIKFFWFHFLG